MNSDKQSSENHIEDAIAKKQLFKQCKTTVRFIVKVDKDLNEQMNKQTADLAFTYSKRLSGYILAYINQRTVGNTAEIRENGDLEVIVEGDMVVLLVSEGDEIEVEEGNFFEFIQCYDSEYKKIEEGGKYTVVKIENQEKIIVK